MMKNITALLFLLFISATVKSQNITGTWYGLLNFPGKQLNIIYHIEKDNDIYSATMESPDQGVKGIPAEKVSFSAQLLNIESPKYGLKFSGTFLPDSNKINGTFKQGSYQFPLVLSRSKPVSQPAIKQPARSQDPKIFPYKQEEVSFINPKAGNSLAGTLTLPTNGKVSKIVILITGSGAQNRDEEIKQYNHRPFLVLSDWLTRQGIAVLRYDDRGIGKSTGIFARATTADFADDTEAAVNYIKSRADLKDLSVGLLGHSEGGMIAPIVASRNQAVKFVVLFAAPGLPSSQVLLTQTTDILKLRGASAQTIERTAATNKKLYTFIKENNSLSASQLNTKIDSLLYQEFSTYPKEELEGAKIEDLVASTGATAHSIWFHYFIGFDPSVYLSKVKCPVLAINGTLDVQVAYQQNLAAIKKNLIKSKNKNFEIVPLTGLNHFFQLAKTGAATEYGQIEETMNPAALEKTSKWINAL